MCLKYKEDKKTVLETLLDIVEYFSRRNLQRNTSTQYTAQKIQLRTSFCGASGIIPMVIPQSLHNELKIKLKREKYWLKLAYRQ
jgi:hypothetical protein